MEGKRTFDLFADRIFVRGHVSLKSSFEINLPLHILNPVWSRFRTRNAVFRAGMIFFGAGLLCGTGLVEMHGPAFFAAMALSLGLAGAFMMLVTVRKIEYAAFQNMSGFNVLTMARSGPDAGKFDEFVGLVAERIAQAKLAA